MKETYFNKALIDQSCDATVIHGADINTDTI